MKHENLVVIGGGGGGVRERYLENCAYLWKILPWPLEKVFFCFTLFVLEATNENASVLLY